MLFNFPETRIFRCISTPRRESIRRIFFVFFAACLSGIEKYKCTAICDLAVVETNCTPTRGNALVDPKCNAPLTRICKPIFLDFPRFSSTIVPVDRVEESETRKRGKPLDDSGNGLNLFGRNILVDRAGGFRILESARRAGEREGSLNNPETQNLEGETSSSSGIRVAF